MSNSTKSIYKKSKKKASLHRLLPLPQEMIVEIMRYLPKQWVMYHIRKVKPLLKGTCVQMENIEYRKHRCIYDIPPQPNNIGKILYCGKKDNEDNYVVQFLKKRQPTYYVAHCRRYISRERCCHCKDIHLGTSWGSSITDNRDFIKCDHYYFANNGEYTLTHKEIRPLNCPNKRQIQMTKKGYIMDV